MAGKEQNIVNIALCKERQKFNWRWVRVGENKEIETLIYIMMSNSSLMSLSSQC